MAIGTAGMVIAAAVVAGAVGAGTAVLLREPARVHPEAAGAGDAVAALQERLDRQEREISSLRARIEETANARGPAFPAPGAPGPGGFAAGDGGGRPASDPDESRAPGQGRASPADLAAMTPEERAKYETVFKEMREKEQEEGRKARLAAYEDSLRARLDRIPEQVGLTAEQKDAAMKVIRTRGEKLRALFEESRVAGAGAGGTAAGADAYRATQEKADAIRREAHDALALTLTQDQVKAVEDATDRAGPGGRATGGGNRGDGAGRRNPRNNGNGNNGNGGGGNQGGNGGGSTPPR